MHLTGTYIGKLCLETLGFKLLSLLKVELITCSITFFPDKANIFEEFTLKVKEHLKNKVRNQIALSIYTKSLKNMLMSFLKKFIRFEVKIIYKVLLTKPNKIYSQLTVSCVLVKTLHQNDGTWSPLLFQRSPKRIRRGSYTWLKYQTSIWTLALITPYI